MPRTAAFDTLKHSILINRLRTFIGLTDSALDWFVSYLSNRSFQVKQNNDTSSNMEFRKALFLVLSFSASIFCLFSHFFHLLSFLSTAMLTIHRFIFPVTIQILFFNYITFKMPIMLFQIGYHATSSKLIPAKLTSFS